MSVSRRHEFAAVVAFIVISTVPAIAHAQKLYFSVYSGNTNTQSSDVRFQQPSRDTDFTIRSLKFDSRYLKESPYYGLRLGTWFKKRSPIGIDLEYRHFKAFGHIDDSRQIDGVVNGIDISGNQRVDNYVTDFRLTDGINTISLNVYYRWMFATSPGFDEGRIQTYIGGGPSYYITYVHSEVNGVEHPKGGYVGEGFGYNVASGVRYGLTNRWALFGEFGYTSARRKTVSIGEDGTATLDIDSFHALFGVQYRIF